MLSVFTMMRNQAMLDTSLHDKVVLLTGANSPYGIGAATAAAFAAQGAAVFITYLRPPPSDVLPPSDALSTPGQAFYEATQQSNGHSVMAAIRASGGRIDGVEADLANPQMIPWLFDQAEACFGPVAVLINNAAHCVQDTFLPQSQLGPDDQAVDGFPMQPIDAELHDRHFAVNSRAVALMMAEFAKRHVARAATWGRIINISTDGASGFATEVSYGASKYALESYSRAAAKELGRFGITVNIASLGPTQTGWITPEMEQDIARNTPLRRVGQPQDVADALVLLASEQARWITGQLLYVGGGWRMG
jgi:3-oxoacyl-[acyl-carrier protein] reductase